MNETANLQTDVIAIQETWLKEDQTLKITNYNIYESQTNHRTNKLLTLIIKTIEAKQMLPN